METHQAIRTKRDTRAFAATAIPEDILERILRAGRMAGSAKALQPVRLIVVRDQAQKEAVAACGRSTAHIPKAAAVVVIVLVPEEGVVGRPFALFRGPFDAGRAAQNMMLAAWEMGITSCPVTLHDDVAAASGSDSRRKSGMYRRTGASSSTRPASTTCINAVAVKVFDVEPMRKYVSGVTGSG